MTTASSPVARYLGQRRDAGSRCCTAEAEEPGQRRVRHTRCVALHILTAIAGAGAGAGAGAPTILPEDLLGDENRGERAVAIVQRMSQKLSGRDFDPRRVLTVAEQVERLIQQATNSENLAPAYVGWCNCW